LFHEVIGKTGRRQSAQRAVNSGGRGRIEFANADDEAVAGELAKFDLAIMPRCLQHADVR